VSKIKQKLNFCKKFWTFVLFLNIVRKGICFRTWHGTYLEHYFFPAWCTLVLGTCKEKQNWIFFMEISRKLSKNRFSKKKMKFLSQKRYPIKSIFLKIEIFVKKIEAFVKKDRNVRKKIKILLKNIQIFLKKDQNFP